MKTSRLLGSLATIAMLAAAPIGLMATPLGATPVQAQESRASFNLFFGELRPHGVWVKHPRYRYVFCPRVDAEWRPYTEGRWIWLKDRGWYFDSREPYAWAVYHYGRWVDDRRLGWCWVPGNQWAPAWVSWRRSNDYVGWAPLPPERDGFSIDINVNVGEPPEDDWVFIPTRRFVEPELSINIIFGDREPERFRETEYVGPVVIQNNVVINNNIDIDFIQQQTNTTVQVVEAQATEDPAAAATEPAEGVIPVFAPEVEAPTEAEAPEAAVEPEQAAEELGRPPESELPPEGEDPAAPAEGEQPADAAPAAEDAADDAAPAEDAAPAGDESAPVTCAEGETLVDGQCVAAEQPVDEAAPAAEEQAAPAEEEAAPAEEEAAPSEEPAAPAEEEAAPAEEEAAPVEEEPAPVEEEAAPAEEQAAPAEEAPAPVEEEAAPAEEEAAPAEEAPAACPDGTVLVDGQCVPAQ